MSKSVPHLLILLLAFSLPFEVIHPVLVLPWFEFTNLELLAIAALVAWIVGSVRSAGMGNAAAGKGNAAWLRAGRDPLIWLPALFLVLALVSAALAPAHRMDALKFTTRSAMGIAIFWMVIANVRSHADMHDLLWALVLGAGASALLGLAEATEWAPLAPLLGLFKEAPTRVGGELRVSASFQYATMAAMYFEVAVPLAVALAATASTRWRRWVALAVALLGTATVVLTFSRAGLVTLAGVLLLLLLPAWRLPRFRPLAQPALLSLGMLFLVTGTLFVQAGAFRTRMVTENDLGWYGAAYSAPASLRLAAGESITVTVAVQNTGTVYWHAIGSNAFALGYYWLAGDQAAQEGHSEVPLPRSVAPGETIDLSVTLLPSLPAGDYQLAWGMLQRDILWFRHRNVPEAFTAVHIDPGTASSTLPQTAAAIPGGDAPALPPTVRRLDLWRAALQMWAERPLLGVGPDNFRLLYGRSLDLPEWDNRLHANNLYLELLAGWGLLGMLAFLGLMLVIARRWLRLWHSATGAVAVWSLALGGGFLAFFVHGVLDYFLEFVPLYLLFWVVAALIVAADRMSGPSSMPPD